MVTQQPIVDKDNKNSIQQIIQTIILKSHPPQMKSVFQLQIILRLLKTRNPVESQVILVSQIKFWIKKSQISIEEWFLSFKKIMI